MLSRKLLPSLVLMPLLCAPAMFSLAADVDCTMCHDSAPIPAAHMEVEEVSVESCTMCHESAADDAFFVTLHNQHGEDLGCDSCHDGDLDARNTRLKEMLASP
ncbi:MAG: cytochrome c3 family protein [Halieaceae bacterium]